MLWRLTLQGRRTCLGDGGGGAEMAEMAETAGPLEGGMKTRFGEASRGKDVRHWEPVLFSSKGELHEDGNS